MSAQRLLLPAERVVRWVTNVADRHAGLDLAVEAGALCGRCDDGTTFTLTPPFGVRFDGDPTPASLVGALVAPDDWGVLLVRKGGFAVARLQGRRIVASKVGQRHVQGRTKAGGQSQQRFARRRDNQARQAYDAAADHAVRLLEDLDGPLVCGGDRPAVDTVLAEPRLRRPRPDARWLHVPDPRRAVLEQAVVDALAVEALIDDPTR